MWHFEADGAIDSSPTVVDDTVFMGSYDGKLYSLDKVTGEKNWHF
jgi:outer membrane protein assembly factor BamB